MIPITDIQTKTGARIRLFDGRAWPALSAENPRGVMLMIDMPQVGDGRHAEVFIDVEAAAALVEGLQG